jgi:hypothetical protein
MRKFAIRDVDPDGEWDNGIVAFIIAPNEDRAREEIARRRVNTSGMDLTVEDVTEVPTYNWTGRG